MHRDIWHTMHRPRTLQPEAALWRSAQVRCSGATSEMCQWTLTGAESRPRPRHCVVPKCRGKPAKLATAGTSPGKLAGLAIARNLPDETTSNAASGFFRRRPGVLWLSWESHPEVAMLLQAYQGATSTTQHSTRATRYGRDAPAEYEPRDI